jgi:hypothetical protein
MSWMQTYTGKRFDFLHPTIDMVCVDDIAHSLAYQCRYFGHTTGHYSIAEHSVRVSDVVPEQFRLQGLLHDAAEAYTGDLVSPLKQISPEYRALEQCIEQLLSEFFGVDLCNLPPSVKLADLTLLATEKRDLLLVQRDDWNPLPTPLPTIIHPWSAMTAEQAFLKRLEQLGKT